MRMTLLAPVHSAPLSRFPGDTARRITRSARVDNGTRLPAGTIYQPSPAGHDNRLGIDVVRIEVIR